MNVWRCRPLGPRFRGSAVAWSVGARSFRTRAEARAYAKQTGQRATGEYQARIGRGMAAGRSRSEARGHPYWEPVARVSPPAKGRNKYRRPDILAGRPGREDPLPGDAARRALRAFDKAFPGQPNVLVAVHGIVKAGQPLQGVSPRIRARIRAAQPVKQAPRRAIWAGSAVLPTAVLRYHLGRGESIEQIVSDVPGLPEMETIDQIELSVPA